MKQNVVLIAMLAGLPGFTFSVETGLLSMLVPSALASDAESAHPADAHDQGDARESHDGGEDAGGSECICPPGIISCTCPDGSAGKPSADDGLPAAPGSLRSVYGK